MAEDIKREQVDALGRKQGLSPNLVDAVRDVLAGKKPEVTTDTPDDQVEEGKKLSSKEKMKRGLYNELDPVDQKAVKKKFVNRKDKDIDNDGDVDNTDKYLHKRRKAISKVVKEGGMSRLATQSSERERLGAKKVKGTGLDTFKKKPAKDTMIANPKTQKVRKVTPSRAKMAVKKGFVYAEHIDGLEEADAFKGQPVGVTVTMKHKQTGQKQKTSFPGTHSAVAGAKSHIAQMQKKGYEVHSKNLMYGKKEEAVNEVSTTTLSNYMRKSAASVSGKDTKTQDKRIAGQSMADKKIRKAGGYSSTAKVAATNEGKDYLEPDMKKRQADNEKARKDMKKMGSPMKNPAFGEASEETEYHVKISGGKYAPGGVETRSVKAKSPEHAIKKVKKGHTNPAGEFTAHPVSEARRGRPPKTGVRKDDDMEASKHIVMQLRKSVSLRGQHPVEFKSGETKKISSAHAQRALNKHNSLRTPIEKKNYMDKLHHSHDSFQKALKDPNPGQGPKKRGVSLAGPKFSR